MLVVVVLVVVVVAVAVESLLTSIYNAGPDGLIIEHSS